MILVLLRVNDTLFLIYLIILKKNVLFQVCTMAIVGLRIFLLISWYIGLEKYYKEYDLSLSSRKKNQISRFKIIFNKSIIYVNNRIYTSYQRRISDLCYSSIRPWRILNSGDSFHIFNRSQQFCLSCCILWKIINVHNFSTLINHKPSLGSCEFPHKVWTGSVQMFWLFKLYPPEIQKRDW